MAGQPHRAGDIDAGGAAERQPFMFEQIEHHRDRLLIGDLECRIHWHALDIAGNAPLSDALGN